MPDGRSTFWLIAGPNGVGKTTYAMRHLRAVSGSVHFVNLDEIARGFLQARATFAMETTLSGRTHLELLKEASARGLATAMLYFSVRSPEICLERIARRVAEGGHDVPEPIVRRRFERSLANLPLYCARCDLWRTYEASGPRPVLAVEGRRDTLRFSDPEVLPTAHPALGRLPASDGNP